MRECIANLAAVAVPTGFREDHLPFGVMLIGPAWTDSTPLMLADRFHRVREGRLGSTDIALANTPALAAPATPPGCALIAVVGAHLNGQPLNWQLTERRVRLVTTCQTAPNYRLFALTGTTPTKPRLIRDLSFDSPVSSLKFGLCR